MGISDCECERFDPGIVDVRFEQGRDKALRLISRVTCHTDF
jgi:hypothetical protein